MSWTQEKEGGSLNSRRSLLLFRKEEELPVLNCVDTLQDKQTECKSDVASLFYKIMCVGLCLALCVEECNYILGLRDIAVREILTYEMYILDVHALFSCMLDMHCPLFCAWKTGDTFEKPKHSLFLNSRRASTLF